MLLRSYGQTTGVGIPSKRDDMTVVFTDLDGTLLDHGTYSWQAARPALAQLKRRGIPLVLVTSKTRSEVEFWRGVLQNSAPFVVENGAAALVPKGYFPFGIPGAISRGGFEVLEWGTPYDVLVSGLDEASRSARCRVLGFHQMSAGEISVACDMPLDQAVLAKKRDHDEPFRILDAARADELLAALNVRGLRWTEGGRFHHVCGKHEKAVAVQTMIHLFRQLHEHVTTIGLGDALNDASFLEVVDVPVVVRSRSATALIDRIPHAILTECSGPRGWNTAILRLIESR